ncbi:MAG: CDP-diacylglycerol--serine O-phosphatidyltransferase [Tannerellaceae bacterium]|jgi:CDP-diacylglycerol--serine O-phosphatidyltransferase|nr:CDP-diacylglycerol--serine O-phosphatidyltransferase [Tannerellaceae bacterium]
MSILRHLPNFITLCSLLAGCAATTFALEGSMRAALWSIVAASCLDFLDGLAARALRAVSAIGKELDSLADLVAFGVAPGMMLFALLPSESPLRYAAFIVPALSALRLARFNVDDRQSEAFLGLPVPAHALLWASLCDTLAVHPQYCQGWWAVVLAIGFSLASLLMISEIPMFSMKIKSWRWRGNQHRYLLAAIALAAIILAGAGGIALTIFAYIALSLINKESRRR